MNSFKTFCVLVICAIALASCISSAGNNQSTSLPSFTRTSEVQNPESPPSQTPNLATPESQSPASGICAEPESEWVVVTIRPDIPDPRCVIIQPDQMLKVVNGLPETVKVSIAKMEATIEPGGEHAFNLPFGQYLAPGGVHTIYSDLCCGGASLWLK